VEYESLVSTDWLYLRYQNEVRSAALETLKQGLHGWEVTDCKITLTDARCISVSMPSSCFAPVIPMAVMDALASAGTTLLEPMLSFEISAPASCAGAILYDLQRMRAVTEPPSTLGNTFGVRGIIPLAPCMGYGMRLASVTGGTGLWLTQPYDYSPCAVELGQPRQRDGANPLDRDEYMIWLKMNHVTVGPMA
jgi:ribosomal protection tetracycline resistance protein